MLLLLSSFFVAVIVVLFVVPVRLVVAVAGAIADFLLSQLLFKSTFAHSRRCGAMNPFLAALILALANPGLGGGAPPGLWILPGFALVLSVL